MSIRLSQPSDAHLFALAETIMGTAVAIDFIGKYSSLFLSPATSVSHAVASAHPVGRIPFECAGWTGGS